MEASGGPCVALRPVFVSGLLDYSYIPEDVISSSTPAQSSEEQEVVCEDGVMTGSESTLGRILPVSCSYTFVVCVSAELASAMCGNLTDLDYLITSVFVLSSLPPHSCIRKQSNKNITLYCKSMVAKLFILLDILRFMQKQCRTGV